MTARAPVIVTRTQPGNARTVKAVRAMGYKAIACPVSQVVRSRTKIPPGNAQALALTSANALQAVAGLEGLTHLPVFTVGEGTAQAARQAGFASVTSADGDAEALARIIARTLPLGSSVLHLSGEDRAGDLAGMLEVMGFAATTRIVYRTRLARGLTERASAAIREGEAVVLIHSARGAERFLTLVRQAQLEPCVARLRFIAISERAAVPLQAPGLDVRVASAPTEARLLDALAETNGAP